MSVQQFHTGGVRHRCRSNNADEPHHKQNHNLYGGGGWCVIILATVAANDTSVSPSSHPPPLSPSIYLQYENHTGQCGQPHLEEPHLAPEDIQATVRIYGRHIHLGRLHPLDGDNRCHSERWRWHRISGGLVIIALDGMR